MKNTHILPLVVFVPVRHTRLSPGTNLDASLLSFPDDFLKANPGKQPDWVVTSPPYKGAVGFVKAALAVATKGVALKLPLSFLEPCADRGGWLVDNPPAVCVFLRRAKYTNAHHVIVGEFWGVWYTDGGCCGNSGGSRLVFALNRGACRRGVGHLALKRVFFCGAGGVYCAAEAPACRPQRIVLKT